MPRPINLEELRDVLDQMLILDVRRKPVFDGASDMLPNASWRDPEKVAEWSTELPENAAIVVYCVHGHQVSQGVANHLQGLGCDVRYLEGGIEGWREGGGSLTDKPGSARS